MIMIIRRLIYKKKKLNCYIYKSIQIDVPNSSIDFYYNILVAMVRLKKINEKRHCTW